MEIKCGQKIPATLQRKNDTGVRFQFILSFIRMKVILMVDKGMELQAFFLIIDVNLKTPFFIIRTLHILTPLRPIYCSKLILD